MRGEKQLDTDNWGSAWGDKREKKSAWAKQKIGEESHPILPGFLPFFLIAEPGLPGYHHHHQHHHHHHHLHHHHHHYFFFLLLLFFGIIQSQAANCKLLKRSEIYNSRFKNTNIVSIFIIVVIIEFGSCCKFGFFFPALHHSTPHLISISDSSHWVISWFVQCVHVTCQIWFQVNFKLTQVDSQFPFSPSPNYSRIRARRQRKLGINLAVKKNLTWNQN